MGCFVLRLPYCERPVAPRQHFPRVRESRLLACQAWVASLSVFHAGSSLWSMGKETGPLLSGGSVAWGGGPGSGFRVEFCEGPLLPSCAVFLAVIFSQGDPVTHLRGPWGLVRSGRSVLSTSLAPGLRCANICAHVIACVVGCPRSSQLQSKRPHLLETQEAWLCADRCDGPSSVLLLLLAPPSAKAPGCTSLLPHL